MLPAARWGESSCARAAASTVCRPIASSIPGKSRQQKFAGLLKGENEACKVVESADPLAADAEEIAKWVEALPVRGAEREIAYTVHDSSFQRHHWINVLRYDGAQKEDVAFSGSCDRISNIVTIRNNGLIEFEVSLNDALVDLNRDVTINVIEGDKTYEAWKGKLERDLGSMMTELLESNQPWRIFPARVAIDMTAVRKAAAEAEAKKKAEEAAKADTEKKGASAEVTDTAVPGSALDR